MASCIFTENALTPFFFENQSCDFVISDITSTVHYVNARVIGVVTIYARTNRQYSDA